MRAIVICILIASVVECTKNSTHRPSFWSKKVNAMKEMQPKKRMVPAWSTQIRPLVHTPTQFDSQTIPSEPLREFANQLINDSASFFGRSYQQPEVEDQSQQSTQQFWDEKDQIHHASSYPGFDYDTPTAYHHSFPPPHPPVHYYPPHKKDDSLFTKFALVALLKLILAKLKAIGFLKVLLLFSLKIPLLFFKMLIAFKGFKFLKLLSIPFLIAAFALPFLPLIPLLIFAFIPFLFLIPLTIPLLLPLLLFLPIIPVTAPPTAQAVTGRERNRRSIEEIIMSTTATPVTEASKRSRSFRTRQRPISQQRRYDYNPFEGIGQEKTENLIELTQRVIQSQHCLERAACEIASYNDSKLYQSAIIWALEKLQHFAPDLVQKRIKKYRAAYELGMQRRSSNFCSDQYHCLRPKVFLVQGMHSYNVI